MCGIAGVIGRKRFELSSDLISLMSHRGPDNTTLTKLETTSASVQLLHHRLSIIDLSDAAHQPFFDESKRYALVFNGEIYNYKELKLDLEREGVVFKTQSDTEVLLHLLIRKKEKAFSLLNGMFALALVDLYEQTMLIGRDPFGEKPFYYHSSDEGFVFSSEIKFILKARSQKFKLNGKVIGEYFSSHFLESFEEETFFSKIMKLPAGSFAVIDFKENFKIQKTRYYNPLLDAPDQHNLDYAMKNLRELVIDSVRLRLRSDVPVGLFLSGGLDSSILASVCSKLNPDINFLSIVSDDPRYDESQFVDSVTCHLKTTSHKINIQNSAGEFWDLLPKVIWHNDEPLISFASIAYFKMIEAAKNSGLKVLLTGQGADEAFLGYKKFKFWHYKNLLKRGKIPSLVNAGIGELFNSDLIESFSLSEALRYFPSGTSDLKTKAWGQTLHKVRRTQGRDTSSLQKIQYDDIRHFSVPILLHYEDRLSMAFGTEVRVPFLDKRIIDQGMSLADGLKIKNGFSKYALRKAFENDLPSEVIWRKDKKGFSIPQEEWMRKDLSSQIGGLFNSSLRIYDLGLLKADQARLDYQAFKEGSSKVLGFKDIFSRLCFEKWLEIFDSSIQPEVEV